MALSLAALADVADARVRPFVYEGGEQVLTIPPGVYYAYVDAVGGRGGADGNVSGGAGGESSGDVLVHPGEKLYVEVGGAGQAVGVGEGNCDTIGGQFECLGTFGGGNGGGNGGPAVTCAFEHAGCDVQSSGAGGGGASDVRLIPAGSGASSLGSRLLVAGAGGGAGASGDPGSVGAAGGAGGQAPPFGSSGVETAGTAGLQATDPSFDIGGFGGGTGPGPGIGGNAGALSQTDCVVANPVPACYFSAHYQHGVEGQTGRPSCPPNQYGFSKNDPSAASRRCGGYGGGGLGVILSGGTTASAAGGGGGGGGYFGAGGGGGGGLHYDGSGPAGWRGGGGGGGGGGSSWVSPRIRPLGPVSGADQAQPDSKGDGEIVIDLQGAFSAYYDGTVSMGRVALTTSGVTVAVKCRGMRGATCNVSGTLTAARDAAAVLGKAQVSLRPGQSSKLRLGLNAAGRRLRSKQRHLRVVLTVSRRSLAGAVVTIKRQTLVF